MMHLAACLLLLATIPYEAVTTDHVDLIETNHFFDEQARHVFTQHLFYEWDGERYQIRDWRLVKGQAVQPHQDGYRVLWHDGTTFRDVRAAQVRESWSQTDYELVERSVLPKELRKELSKPLTRREKQWLNGN